MKTFKFIALSFFSWRIWILIFLLAAVLFVPSQFHLLGGGLRHYQQTPWFWGWANFDGEHYLSIAQHGYGAGEQGFFPLYPLLMRILAWPWRGNLVALNIAGLVISHVSLFLALWGLWKLIKLDFKENIANLALLLLLAFPTSFYFGSVYTESLFLAVVVWSFYFARQRKWWWAGILGALASATRFIGIFLLPALLVELIIQKKHKPFTIYRLLFTILPLFIIPAGLFAYMYYLWQTTGNPFAFWTSLTVFGEQRSAVPIILPQVFFRYAKILVTATWNDPIYYTVVLELLTTLLFLILSVWSFFKTRLSYAIFLTLGYLAPTFSGSFSSLPRYVLVLFPGFILLALWLVKKPVWVKVAVLGSFVILLAVSTILFVRGYWVA